MSRRTSARTILARGGQLVPPEAAPPARPAPPDKTPAGSVTPLPPLLAAPPARPNPHPTLPWVFRSDPPVCATCGQEARRTFEGHRERRECLACGWVATANQRLRVWEIEEAA